ncbi:HNH endonuclease [Levilactobacillus brevis]|uniref:HNH endonuclease n=1 Tax=Levilactobacillus brevis TaxID=1580 RepID=UPI00325BCCCC
MSEYRQIPGYENLYEASSNGTIWSCEGKTTFRNIHGKRQKRVWKRRQIIPKREKRQSSTHYDLRVDLWKDGSHQTMLVHRLIAMSFIPNPQNKPCINHIDGNSENNRPENLEWCTYKENQIHAFRTGLNKHRKCVELISTYDHKHHTFYSMAEASKFLKMSHSFVSGLVSRGIMNFGEYKILIKD